MNQIIFEATDQNFRTQVIESPLPTLIEFTADWCPPCKMLAPIVNDIAHKYHDKLRVGLLDSDANPEIIQQYSVMGLPTLILFVGGSPVSRIVGYRSGEYVESKLLPYLATEKA